MSKKRCREFMLTGRRRGKGEERKLVWGGCSGHELGRNHERQGMGQLEGGTPCGSTLFRQVLVDGCQAIKLGVQTGTVLKILSEERWQELRESTQKYWAAWTWPTWTPGPVQARTVAGNTWRTISTV